MIPVLVKDVIKCLTNGFLRRRKALSGRICGIRHQCQHSGLSEFGKSLKIDHSAKHGCIVHLEISGMHQNPGRRKDRQRSGIGNGMIGADEFHPDRAEFHRISIVHDMTLNIIQDPMLFQFVLDQPHGKPCGIDRHLKLLFYIRNRADVILMSVSDHQALHLLPILQ